MSRQKCWGHRNSWINRTLKIDDILPYVIRMMPPLRFNASISASRPHSSLASEAMRFVALSFWIPPWSLHVRLHLLSFPHWVDPKFVVSSQLLVLSMWGPKFSAPSSEMMESDRIGGIRIDAYDPSFAHNFHARKCEFLGLGWPSCDWALGC